MDPEEAGDAQGRLEILKIIKIQCNSFPSMPESKLSENLCFFVYFQQVVFCGVQRNDECLCLLWNVLETELAKR